MEEPELSKSVLIEARLANWTRALAIFTGLLALASLASTGAVLYDEVQKSYEEQRTENQRRAAIVIIYGIGTTSGDDGSAIPTLDYALKNVGATRTDYTKGFGSVKFFRNNDIQNVDFSKPSVPTQDLSTIIGPNDTAQSVPIAISKQDIQASLRGEGKIIAWARTEYATIYKPKDTLISTSCLFMIPSLHGNTISFDLKPVNTDCNKNG